MNFYLVHESCTKNLNTRNGYNWIEFPCQDAQCYASCIWYVLCQSLWNYKYNNGEFAMCENIQPWNVYYFLLIAKYLKRVETNLTHIPYKIQYWSSVNSHVVKIYWIGSKYIILQLSL